MSNIPEVVAARIFWQAIAEGRAAELLQHLFEGGGVTLMPNDGAPPTLILISASDIERLRSGG